MQELAGKQGHREVGRGYQGRNLKRGIILIEPLYGTIVSVLLTNILNLISFMMHLLHYLVSIISILHNKIGCYESNPICSLLKLCPLEEVLSAHFV